MIAIRLFPLVTLLGLTLPGYGFPTAEQQVLVHDDNQVLKVRNELIVAEIIPTVVDDFVPSFLLNITWASSSKNSKKKSKTAPTADLGNTLKPKKLQDAPNVYFEDAPLSAVSKLALDGKDMQYTIAMTDPDAPSRDNPEWSQICHWIVTGVRIDQDSLSIADSDVEEIMPYKAPGPPPKTGKHRYVFLLLAPINRTTEPLELTKPKDRQHWGYDDERKGVREWMKDNSLEVVGANFIYAKNKKQ
jgi:phosphatidylethanolamine-binding protein